ncbi:putative diaminohydroxyphosphoribosylaminopyrimidine deaminase [Helianthus anomalus]
MVGCVIVNYGEIIGCVIVKYGEIVGEGFHPKASQPQAEVFFFFFFFFFERSGSTGYLGCL